MSSSAAAAVQDGGSDAAAAAAAAAPPPSSPAANYVVAEENWQLPGAPLTTASDAESTQPSAQSPSSPPLDSGPAASGQGSPTSSSPRAGGADGRPPPLMPDFDALELSIPGKATQEVWNLFCELDEDRSGQLDLKEFTALVRKLKLDWGKRKTRRAYNDMSAFSEPSNFVTFMDFAHWWSSQQAILRCDLKGAMLRCCCRRFVAAVA
jgi:hypothetical protein